MSFLRENSGTGIVPTGDMEMTPTQATMVKRIKELHAAAGRHDHRLTIEVLEYSEAVVFQSSTRAVSGATVVGTIGKRGGLRLFVSHLTTEFKYSGGKAHWFLNCSFDDERKAETAAEYHAFRTEISEQLRTESKEDDKMKADGMNAGIEFGRPQWNKANDRRIPIYWHGRSIGEIYRDGCMVEFAVCGEMEDRFKSVIDIDGELCGEFNGHKTLNVMKCSVIKVARSAPQLLKPIEVYGERCTTRSQAITMIAQHYSIYGDYLRGNDLDRELRKFGFADLETLR